VTPRTSSTSSARTRCTRRFLADLIDFVETFEEAIHDREEGKGGSTAARASIKTWWSMVAELRRRIRGGRAEASV
jgi:hypothetical protein